MLGCPRASGFVAQNSHVGGSALGHVASRDKQAETRGAGEDRRLTAGPPISRKWGARTGSALPSPHSSGSSLERHQGTSVRPETASASQQIALRQQPHGLLSRCEKEQRGEWRAVAARPRPAPPRCLRSVATQGEGALGLSPRDRRRGSAGLGSITESGSALRFPCPVCAAGQTRLPPRDGRKATVAAQGSALQFWALVSHGPLGS